MRNNYIFIVIFTAIVLIIDLYTFRGIRKFGTGWNEYLRYGLISGYWLVPVLIIGMIAYMSFFRPVRAGTDLLPLVQFVLGFFVLFYIPKLVFIVFQLGEDVIHLLAKAADWFSPAESIAASTARKISRSEFLSRVGIFAAAIPFVSIANGILRGRFDFTVRRHTLQFPNLPAAFDGLKVVQISDFHIGSFIGSEEHAARAVQKINEQQADIILFTGDIVNNKADELQNFLPVLKKLKAPLGKYAILGNHDYGDYVRWPNLESKQKNLSQLKEHFKTMDFKLLLNESEKIIVDGQELGLIGVENWGLPPFPQYGDLEKAQQNSAAVPFKILLSHDPAHWEAEVLDKTDIDLTLSGHTHGMQFGIEIPGWRWSPVNLRYKYWGGLYKEKGQYLYVNTGIGFIAFPGRVGMPPEITVLELKKG